MEVFMPTKSLLFTTGQFARLHHLNKRTLHYYDEIGLFSPAFKGENDYRYYTWQQSADLENILALRELHMSIDEIRSYLHSPNAQSFLALSERKIGEIDETIQHLTKLRAIMQKKQEMLHLSMQIKDGQIDTVRCEEEYLLSRRFPLRNRSRSRSKCRWTPFFPTCRPHGICPNTRPAAEACFPWKNQAAPFRRVRRPVHQPGAACTNQWYLQKTCRALPARFLCGQLGQASRTLWPDAGLCPEKGWELQGYSYEIGLNEFAISDSEEYVTQVTILVS